MKFLLRRFRDLSVSLVLGVLAGFLLLSIDHFVCGEVNGQNSAGGGAAIGMLALAIAGSAMLLTFIVLSCTDLASHFGFIEKDKTWKLEVGGIACLFVILVVVIAQIERRLC